MSAGSRRTSAPGLWLEAARLSTGNTNDKQPDGSNQQRGTILTGNDQLGSPLANGPLISKTRYEAARDSLSTLQIGDRRSDFRRGQYHRETSKTRNKATIREKHKTKKNENNNQGKQDTRKKGLQQSYGPSSSSSNSIDGIEPPTRIPQILPTYTPSDQWHFSGQQFYFEHKGEQKQPFILTEQYSGSNDGDDDDSSFRPTIILSSLGEHLGSIDHIDGQSHSHPSEEHLEQQPTFRLHRHNARENNEFSHHQSDDK